MANFRKWDSFKIHAASISKILTNPPSATDLTKAELSNLTKTLEKPDKEPGDIEFIDKCRKKKDRFLNPALSEGAKNHLIERYFKDKYNSSWVSTGNSYPAFLLKGASLETLAIEILSRVDGVDFTRPTEAKSSDFLMGRPDIFCYDHQKLVDIKIVWNATSFGKLHTQKLSLQTYCQLNAYMEIYGFEEAEACYMLLNTPLYLVEQKQKEIFRKFIDGTLTRDDFDERMSSLASQFDFEKKIPETKRIIRYCVKKDEDLLNRVHQKLPLCREFLAKYDRIFMKNNKIVTLPQDYKKISKLSDQTEENNAEPDSDESHQNQSGG